MSCSCQNQWSRFHIVMMRYDDVILKVTQRSGDLYLFVPIDRFKKGEQIAFFSIVKLRYPVPVLHVRRLHLSISHNRNLKTPVY